MKATLNYDPASGRFKLGDHELHCGECFQVLVPGPAGYPDPQPIWYDARIEHASTEIDHGWYLVGPPWRDYGGRIEGLEGRFYD